MDAKDLLTVETLYLVKSGAFTTDEKPERVIDFFHPSVLTTRPFGKESPVAGQIMDPATSNWVQVLPEASASAPKLSNI
ncbi:MAG: hypothetical protein M3N08_10730 [Pseudomonadota bacterium]|nr:hypothetical protein [Pseudomonadota bacterium]